MVKSSGVPCMFGPPCLSGLARTSPRPYEWMPAFRVRDIVDRADWGRHQRSSAGSSHSMIPSEATFDHNPMHLDRSMYV